MKRSVFIAAGIILLAGCSDNVDAAKVKTPKPKADLRVQKIELVTKSPVSGAPSTFSITIQNRDNSASSACALTLYVDGQTLASTTVDPILGRGKTVVNLAGAVPSGSHRISAMIDSLNQILEKNENNNSKFLNVSIAPSPTEVIIVGRVVDYGSGNPVQGAIVSVGGKTVVSLADGSFSLGGLTVSESYFSVNGQQSNYWSFWARIGSTSYNAGCIPLPTLDVGANDVGTIQLMSMDFPPPFPPFCD